MNQIPLRLSLLPGEYAVHRFAPHAELPVAVFSADFFAVVRTTGELSVVAPQALDLASEQVERDWRILKVLGPLDFSLTGILAGLAVPLAEAKIPIFAISTYDTDYLLVKQAHLGVAIGVLQSSGYVVDNE